MAENFFEYFRVNFFYDMYLDALEVLRESNETYAIFFKTTVAGNLI